MPTYRGWLFQDMLFLSGARTGPTGSKAHDDRQPPFEATKAEQQPLTSPATSRLFANTNVPISAVKSAQAAASAASPSSPPPASYSGSGSSASASAPASQKPSLSPPRNTTSSAVVMTRLHSTAHLPLRRKHRGTHRRRCISTALCRCRLRTISLSR